MNAGEQDASRRIAKRFGAAFLVFCMLALGALVAPAAAQDDDFDPAADSRVVRLDATYTVMPDEQIIDAVEIITVSNVKASTSRYYFFWTGHDIRVPVDAQNLTITSNGRDLPFVEAGETEWLLYGSVEFPSNLLFGQKRTLEVRYQLSSDRSVDGQVRVNTALFEGYTVTCCDFEDVDIKLVAPLGFSITPDADFSYDRTVEGDLQTFQYTANELESGFTEAVVTDWSGVNLDGFVRDRFTVGGSTVELTSPPDDPVWQRNLKRLVPQLDEGLTERVGRDWLADDLELRAGRNAVFGDDGWVNVNDPLIVVPIDYTDAAMAMTLARRAAPDLGLRIDDVRAGGQRILASEALDSAVSSERLDSLKPGGGVIRSGHNSHWFAEQLAGEDGWVGLVELADFANSSTTTWPGLDGAEDLSELAPNWRRIIDVANALDRPEAIEAIEAFQLDDDELAELDEHRDRVDQLRELEDDTDRPAPIGIRRALTNWEHESTEDLIAAARETLVSRDSLIAAGDDASLQIEIDLGVGWDDAESEGDFADLASGYEERTAIIGRLEDSRASVASERSFVEGLGFDQPAADAQLAAAATAIEQDELGDAEAALDATDRLVGDASTDGQRTLITWIAIAVGVLVAVVLLLWLWRRSRKRKASESDGASAGKGAMATTSAVAGAKELDADPVIDLTSAEKAVDQLDDPGEAH